MSVPLKATNFHTTERLLELALTMLENARREQNNDQLPANNWLTNNFTLEIIRAEVAAPEFWGEVQPPASLKGLDIPSRRADFVPWKPSRRRGFGMGNPTFR